MLPIANNWYTEPIIVTNAKNYSMANIEQLFQDAKVPVSNTCAYYTLVQTAWKIFKNEAECNKMVAPNVPIHCIYGINVPTMTQVYIDNIEQPHDVRVLRYLAGDGVATNKDLALCDTFQNLQPQQVTVHRFNGTDHALMIQEHRVMDVILSFATFDQP